MGRTPCCTKMGLNRGPWTPEEDGLLSIYIQKHGEGRWRTLPKKAGLLRCGKSCRLRWMNYLRPDVKRGPILPEEEDLILKLHRLLGNRWSLIAGRIPGRTDNEVKNYWNTHLSRKLISQGIDPRTHRPLAESEIDNHSPNEGNNKVDSENELNPSSDSQYKYPETATVDDNIETSKLVKDTELPETLGTGSLRDITDINASNTIMAPVLKDTSCYQDSSNAANIARKLIPHCNASSKLGIQDQDASLYLRRNSITNKYFMAPATTVSGLENIPGFPDSITENPTNESHSVHFDQFDMQQRQMPQGIHMDVSPITTGATSEDYNSDIFSYFLESFMGGEGQLREESNKHVGSSEHRQQFLHTETPVHLGYNIWSILSPSSQLPERP